MPILQRFEPYLDRIFEGIVNSHGELTPDERSEVIDYATELAEGGLNTPSFLHPLELQLLQMVVFSSHEITNSLIEEIKKANIREDRILEVMYCAAFGAGNTRYKALKRALE